MPYWTTYKRIANDPTGDGAWQLADNAEAAALIRRFSSVLNARALEPSGRPPLVRKVQLGFYNKKTWLFELALPPFEKNPPIYLLVSGSKQLALDGSDDAIYRFNAWIGLSINEKTVIDYVRFFCAHVIRPGGRWQIAEFVDDLRWRFSPGEDDQDRIAVSLRTLSARPNPRYGGLRVRASGVLDQNLHSVTFSVSTDGKVATAKGPPLVQQLPVVRDILDDFPGGHQHLNMKSGWTAVTDEDRHEIATRFGLSELSSKMRFLSQSLSFLPGLRLLRLDRHTGVSRIFGYALWGDDLYLYLPCKREEYDQAIESQSLDLNSASIIDYVSFYGFFFGFDGQYPCHLAARPSDLNTSVAPRNLKNGDSDWLSSEYKALATVELNRWLSDPSVEAHEDGSAWNVEANLQCGDILLGATILVTADGHIELISGYEAIEKIPLNRNWNVLSTLEVLQDPGKDNRANTRFHPDSLDGELAAGKRQIELLVLKKIVRQKLVDGLRATSPQSVFNASDYTDDAALLTAFGEFVARLTPIIIFQSDIPFCEEIVGLVLADHVTAWPVTHTVTPAGTDETHAHLENIKDGLILQLSFHQIHALTNPEHTAHQMAVADSAVLIGCEQPAAVPEALRHVADIRISFDRFDTRSFRAVFEAIFDASCPQGAPGLDEHWQRYIVPDDFFRPLRQQIQAASNTEPAATAGPDWDAQQALDDIHRRVEARLISNFIGAAPSLDEVHGLDEAKAVARDLIEDISNAIAGGIAWEEADRGMLLVGAPGTGKTMLARSIAKACKVAFINTSAATWVAGTEHLGQHIRKIRGVFAEARRLAPCILFVDELDTIGNREKFTGRNQQYNVEIVNTLLQELQGFEQRQPVFVIGATNHVDNIDAALLRAGRLDNIVRIPLPNRAALEAIFDYHLIEHRKHGGETGEIDTRLLASIARGSSGADVKRFIRDAARRARKAEEPMSSHHLASAVTGRPRNDRTLAMIDDDTLGRTAVHESGHAILLLACREFPGELSIVSIVPHDDGRLGFTGTSSPEQVAITRAGYREYLMVLLAGRAAEEIVYGSEGISSGSGGNSEKSDLAVATRMAINMISKLGMSRNAGLRWTDTGSAAARDEARVLLDEAYQAAKNTLLKNRKLLDSMTSRLVEKHEVLAAELSALAADHRLSGCDEAAFPQDSGS